MWDWLRTRFAAVVSRLRSESGVTLNTMGTSDVDSIIPELRTQRFPRQQ